MTPSAAGSPDIEAPPRRPLPSEGGDGIFSETWFPVCLSNDVKSKQVIGRDFLDGRIAIYRDSHGKAHIFSAYCPHLGTDLSCGDIVDDRLRCPFHHWQFDHSGQCVQTAVADPPPKAARLFRFPVYERYGIIYAFNGVNPSWEPPTFPYPDAELCLVQRTFPNIGCEPWVVCANTPDVQHIRALHKVHVENPKDIAYTDHSMRYAFRGRHLEGHQLEWNVAIHGTNIFFQEGETGGTWVGVAAPMGLPRPGQCEIYMVVATRIKDRSPAGLAKAKADAEALMALEEQIVFEDVPILQRIRYRQGLLTRSDMGLAQFLDYLRKYPRSHRSSDFIK